MAKGQANFSGSEEERRKRNFFTSMKNNADVKKRFGGDVNKAYEAMRREAARKGTLTRSDSRNTALANAARRRTTSAAGDGPVKKGSPWQRFQANGGVSGRRNSEGKTLGDQFREDTKKFSGAGWYRNHVAGQKPGAKAFMPDDILGHKARQARYAANAAKNGKTEKPKTRPLSAAELEGARKYKQVR